MKILDRYMARQFFKIFGICVLGVPFIFIVIDLTDHLDNFLAEQVARGDVALYYLYQFPYQTLLAFPIAALLAAVFTVSRMTRHFEVTAAKAGGVSFYRIAAPVVALGAITSLVALGLTEIVPKANRKAAEALGENLDRSVDARLSFIYRGKGGRYYQVRRLDVSRGRMANLRIDREGSGFTYPSYTILAPTAEWDSARGLWVMKNGRIRYFPDESTTLSFRFRELWQREFTETPAELLANPKEPDEMGYRELGRYIEAVERSGGDARKFRVQQALKLAFPFTCLIIVLFGTPLANTTRRGGAALSIGIALATTIVFLTVIRISEALGAGGVVSPMVAAWLPNGIFLAAGLVMMVRVRT